MTGKSVKANIGAITALLSLTKPTTKSFRRWKTFIRRRVNMRTSRGGPGLYLDKRNRVLSAENWIWLNLFFESVKVASNRARSWESLSRRSSQQTAIAPSQHRRRLLLTDRRRCERWSGSLAEDLLG